VTIIILIVLSKTICYKRPLITFCQLFIDLIIVNICSFVHDVAFSIIVIIRDNCPLTQYISKQLVQLWIVSDFVHDTDESDTQGLLPGGTRHQIGMVEA